MQMRKYLDMIISFANFSFGLNYKILTIIPLNKFLKFLRYTTYKNLTNFEIFKGLSLGYCYCLRQCFSNLAA